jgi:hypothetical protein
MMGTGGKDRKAELTSPGCVLQHATPMGTGQREVLKFVAHSMTVLKIAIRQGWLPGARYTNLRDVRKFDRLGFLDIDWENYCYKRHLAAVRQTRPLMTVARDITDRRMFRQVLAEAEELERWATHVIVVPKCRRLTARDIRQIPRRFVIGYSVPTSYGATTLDPEIFRRPVHLLGGRPDVQRRLAARMPVVSFDCNRFTLDAAFGDYFDGRLFRPHPRGGYHRCLSASIRNINDIWSGYVPPLSRHAS